jgi:hypothetical protein
MNTVPQIEPVTNLQRSYRTLFAKLDKGPVVLSQASRAAAVLVSVEEWDWRAQRLAYLERIVTGDRAVADRDFVNADEVDTTFNKMGIV